MTGSSLPARFMVRRGMAVLAIATAFVPASASVAAAWVGPLPLPVSAEERIEALKERARDAASPVFATVAGEELVLPGVVRHIGFHESGTYGALAMTPVGRMDRNLNGDRIALPAVNGYRNRGYTVLPTRQRSGGPTTAVDLSMPVGVPVVSPVSGTVVAANPYNLYGTTPDEIVEIVPEGRPDLRLRMMHVEGLAVRAGQAVEAGETILAAQPRHLPFPSQIDRYAGSHPHVHLEMVHRLPNT